MQELVFWIFAAGLVISGLGVIINRNPVSSAVCLVSTFICMAALMATLEAFFLAIAQVIVYAGAVMVLFLFVIMLLDIKAEQKRPIPWMQILCVGTIAFIFASFFLRVLASLPQGDELLVWGQSSWPDYTKALGVTLFSDYVLPFLVTGLLLLLATIGVVLLSKKDLQ
jgi:NADH-quinone oxidoreductase subunit J